eukprot:1610554-Amphidinium_carterae.2
MNPKLVAFHQLYMNSRSPTIRSMQSDMVGCRQEHCLVVTIYDMYHDMSAPVNTPRVEFEINMEATIPP